MRGQFLSEFRKMRTTRTNLGLLVGLVALILLGVVAGAFSSEADLSVLENQRELIGNGAFAAAFAALIGASWGSPANFDTARFAATFLVTPALTRVVVAKVFASIVVGISFGALGSGLALGCGAALIRARGYDLLIDAGDVSRLLLGTMIMSAGRAALGVGFGALVSQPGFRHRRAVHLGVHRRGP